MQDRDHAEHQTGASEVERLIDEALPNQNIGSRGVDPWGLNINTAQAGWNIVRWLYESYFRVEAVGLENVPASGRLLIVGNHSGQLPLDGVMVGYAAASNPNGPRLPRTMVERWFASVPYLGDLVNQFGGVVGDPVNCAKMLEHDEAVVVFPEGIRGSGKPYRLRYQLQRFGHGFVHLAMEHKTPIVPVGIVGAEETMPSLGNIKPLARLLNVPYFPFAPLVPLPAKMVLHFGEPLYFDNNVSDANEVERRVETVKDSIRDLIEAGLAKRNGKN